MPTNERVEYLPLTVAAAELHVSYMTLRGMIRNGEIEAVYSGAKRQRAQYITRKALEAAKANFGKRGAL